MPAHTSGTPRALLADFRQDEKGATTIGATFAAACLCILLIVGMTLVGVVYTKHQVHNAADAAALAAADYIPHHSEQACTYAADYLADIGNVQLVECQVNEHPHTRMPAVWIVVSAHFARWDITAHSCAGPIPPR